jgi:hypothetical protein
MELELRTEWALAFFFNFIFLKIKVWCNDVTHQNRTAALSFQWFWARQVPQLCLCRIVRSFLGRDLEGTLCDNLLNSKLHAIHRIISIVDVFEKELFLMVIQRALLVLGRSITLMFIMQDLDLGWLVETSSDFICSF